MQRSTQLLALGGRLAAAGCSGGVAAVAASGSASAWSSTAVAGTFQPAQHLAASTIAKTWSRAAGGEAQQAASAAARRHTVARRGFATEAAAVARPGPVPRGTSRAGSGRSMWSGLFLLAPGALAAFLGKWQWERREWKRELLERRQAMMQGDPLDLFSLEEEPSEYSRVWVEGVLDHGASQFVGPRTRQIAGNSRQGFLLMTPLRQVGSSRAVLVNRGWVPSEWREDVEQQKAGQPEGKVRLEGILRHGEDPGSFVPANEPVKGNWFYVNVSELATAAGLPPQAPLVEVVTEEAGSYIGRGPPTAMDVLGGRARLPQVEEAYPLPKSMKDMMHFSVMPQDHFNYAATWWTLSGATLLLAVKAIRQGVKPR